MRLPVLENSLILLAIKVNSHCGKVTLLAALCWFYIT